MSKHCPAFDYKTDSVVQLCLTVYTESFKNCKLLMKHKLQNSFKSKLRLNLYRRIQNPQAVYMHLLFSIP